VSSPPTTPTDVAPILFMKRAPRASRTAFTTISSLSIGDGTKRLVTNIIEPNSAAVNNRLVFCNVPPFSLNGAPGLKNFDVTHQKSEWKFKVYLHNYSAPNSGFLDGLSFSKCYVVLTD
jgi:hypothetical protein